MFVGLLKWLGFVMFLYGIGIGLLVVFTSSVLGLSRLAGHCLLSYVVMHFTWLLWANSAQLGRSSDFDRDDHHYPSEASSRSSFISTPERCLMCNFNLRWADNVGVRLLHGNLGSLSSGPSRTRCSRSRDGPTGGKQDALLSVSPHIISLASCSLLWSISALVAVQDY